MQILHIPDDPFITEALQYLAQFALEAPQANMRVQFDSITLSCTANTLSSQAMTFKKPFLNNPTLLLFANPATNTSTVTPSYSSLTQNGFTALAYTGTTQNVTLSYLAIGPV